MYVKIERNRDRKRREFMFNFLQNIVRTSCLSFPSTLSFFFLFFFLFFDSASDELCNVHVIYFHHNLCINFIRTTILIK